MAATLATRAPRAASFVCLPQTVINASRALRSGVGRPAERTYRKVFSQASSSPFEDSSPKFAVLVDAENAQFSSLKYIMIEVTKYGEADVRRVYGDFTKPQLAPWKSTTLEHSFRAVQQFSHVSGKSSSDFSMVMDAMDLLHLSRHISGFCLVSSDADFTGLAQRLREGGKRVLGFGERKTPRSFTTACNTFVYTDNLMPASEKAGPIVGVDEESLAPLPPAVSEDSELLDLLERAYSVVADEGGRARLDDLGNCLKTIQSDFDTRTYGIKKLSDLLVATRAFRLEADSKGHLTVVAADERS